MKKSVFGTKVRMFTHNDLDGVGCGIVGRVMLGNDIVISYINNHEVDSNVEECIKNHDKTNEYDLIIFSDLCPSQNALQNITTYFPGKVVVLDHHKSNIHAIDILKENGIVEADMDKNGKFQCGTSLVYRWLSEHYNIKLNNQKLMEEFVETVRSYDTYQWKTENNIQAKYLQTLCGMLSNETFVDKYVARLSDGRSKKLIRDTEMEFVLSRVAQENESIEKIIGDLKNVGWQSTINDKAIAIMFYPGGVNISELGYRFLEKYKQFDIFVAINTYYGTFNFRARDRVDATPFAIGGGGGGHPRACGCNIPKEIIDDFLRNCHKCMKKFVSE